MNWKPVGYRAITTFCLTFCTLIPLTNVSAGEGRMEDHAGMQDHAKMKSEIALSGYCPVCVIEMGKWDKGNPEIRSTYDNHTYTFPSRAIQAKFDANPEKYIPVLHGDCAVCLKKHGKRVPGSVYHSVLHQGRLFLFPSEKEKNAFKEDSRAFANADLAAKGECIVCRKKMGKHVPGSPNHTVIHDGLRYLFPSDKEAAVFRQSPGSFAESKMTDHTMVHDQMVHEDKMKMQPSMDGGHEMSSKGGMSKKEGMSKKDVMSDKKGMSKSGKMSKSDTMSMIPEGETTMIKADARSSRDRVRLVGRSGCAGCEFGVSPIGAPQELGLVVVDDQGRVTVIEGAHQDYPQIYSDRFEHQQLLVEGRIIKTDGKVSWLKPSSVQVIR